MEVGNDCRSSGNAFLEQAYEQYQKRHILTNRFGADVNSKHTRRQPPRSATWKLAIPFKVRSAIAR